MPQSDSDAALFTKSGLHRTPEGRIYLDRLRDLNAVKNRLRCSLGSATSRRYYIDLSNECAAALAELEKRHHWPPP